jgi:uncharacterized protein
MMPTEPEQPGNKESLTSPIATPPPAHSLLAAPWHTALVLLLLLGIGALSAWSASRLPPGSPGPYDRIANYELVFVWEWLTVAFIAWGIGRRGYRLSDLVGGSWPGPQAFLRDLGVSILFLVGSGLVLGALQYALRSTPNRAVRDLLPQTTLESLCWLLLSATAGFCEETIFRGYLQRQLGVVTRSASVALLLQGVLFGMCHGYQGLKSIVTLSVYGCFFGILAHRQKSLRPGMMAHFLQDGVGGLVLREALKRMPA